MRVWVDGNSRVTRLTKQEFVGQGGQGSVYARRDVAYKIYTDPKQMIPLDKIAALSSIQDPAVIKPEKVLRDGKGCPIGYTMRFLANTMALCAVFPRAFRERSGVTPDQVVDWVLQIRRTVEHIHQAGILIVDLNEMNLLMDASLQTVSFIDVDSYQTPSHPATAIMDSVRDRHMQPGHFTELTDWFAFAVISFQLFCGIHPYKGRHPSLKGLDVRMRENVSVLHSDVRVPKATYPVSVIPPLWRSWYEAVFERGRRLPAPDDVIGSLPTVPLQRPVRSDKALQIDDIATLPARILRMDGRAGVPCAVTADGVYVDGRRVRAAQAGTDRVAIGFTPRQGIPVVASLAGGKLDVFDTASRAVLPVHLEVDELTEAGERLLVRSGDQVLELRIHEVGANRVLTFVPVAQVLPHATRLYPACLLYNMQIASS